MNEDKDPIQNAVATLIICLGLSILIPYVVRSIPNNIHIQVEMNVNRN